MLDSFIRNIFHPVFWFPVQLFISFTLIFFGNPEVLDIFTYSLALILWAFNLDMYYKTKELEQKKRVRENIVQEDLEKFYRTKYLHDVLKNKTDLRSKYKNTKYRSYAVKVYDDLIQELLSKLNMNLEKKEML